MHYRIGLRHDVSPNRFCCDGLHLIDRLIGIRGSIAVGAGHRLLRSPVVYSPAIEELASRF